VDVIRSAPPLNTDPGRKLPACDQRPDPIGTLQVKAARLDDLGRHQKHWHHTRIHLELRRYFGIIELLNEESPCDPGQRPSDSRLPGVPSGQGIRDRSRRRVPGVGWTPGEGERPRRFGTGGLLDALRARHGFFGSLGAKLSDHGIPFTYSEPCDEAEAGAIYSRARAGPAPNEAEALKFRSFMLRFFAESDAGAGWTKQLHLGALRNTNRRRLAEFGPDTGYDSIGDWPQAEPLARYLDQLETAGKLPKMILYNLNPADNYVLATMIGTLKSKRRFCSPGKKPGVMEFTRTFSGAHSRARNSAWCRFCSPPASATGLRFS
jgi:hypothetical protein